jgi:hypothetical protein
MTTNGAGKGKLLHIGPEIKKLVGVFALITFLSIPNYAQAQWPPFSYRMISTYNEGKITYKISFSRKVKWPMADVLIKIPVPEGTRYLESGGPDGTLASFDGVEVTFFTPTVNRPLRDIYFVVEVTDPAKTEFATHSWIAWKGDVPGDYLTGDSVIDITRTPLIWSKPLSRLRLEASASVDGNLITYYLFPVNIGGRRMWDLNITLPLPAGTTFVSAEAPPPFTAGFDGQQAVFTITEFERGLRVEPLKVQVSAAGVVTPSLTTLATAGWTNVGSNVIPQEYTETGEIIVQPNSRQYVVADRVGDAPFSNYDLKTLAFQQDGEQVKTTFYTAETMGEIGQPIEHYLYFDTDCNAETGKSRGNRGAEYWLRYRHQNGRGYIYTWDPVESTWTNRQTLSATGTGNSASVWLPAATLPAESPVCWLALARNRTEQYHPTPPIDWVGVEPRLTTGVLASP